MQNTKYTQVKAIIGENPVDAAEKFNDAMRDLKGFSDLKYEREGNTFLIYYTVSEAIPETIAETREMEGNCGFCKDCEHCRRDVTRFGITDQRKKWARCVWHDKPVMINSSACDDYYMLDFRKGEKQ